MQYDEFAVKDVEDVHSCSTKKINERDVKRFSDDAREWIHAPYVRNERGTYSENWIRGKYMA